MEYLSKIFPGFYLYIGKTFELSLYTEYSQVTKPLVSTIVN